MLKDSTVMDDFGLYIKCIVSKAGRISDRLVRGFQSLCTVDPSIAREYYLDKGLAYARKGEYARAVKLLEPIYRQAEERGEAMDPQLLLSLGVALLHVERSEEGVKLLERAHAEDDASERVTIALGIAYTRVEAYEKAIPLLERVRKERPDNFNVLHKLGIAYDHVKDFDRAIEAFEAALKLRPDKTALYRAIGFAYEQKGDRESAVAYFKKASEQEDV